MTLQTTFLWIVCPSHVTSPTVLHSAYPFSKLYYPVIPHYHLKLLRWQRDLLKLLTSSTHSRSTINDISNTHQEGCDWLSESRNELISWSDWSRTNLCPKLAVILAWWSHANLCPNTHCQTNLYDWHSQNPPYSASSTQKPTAVCHSSPSFAGVCKNI